MATIQDVIRKITVVGSAQGVDQTTASLEKLATAQGNVAVAVERQEKATISAQAALERLQRSVDAEYRSEQQLAAAERTLEAARAQGLITLDKQNQLLALAATRYKGVAEQSKVAEEATKTLREAAVGLAAGFGVGIATAGLAELPSKLVETVKDLADLKDEAETIGITAENLQKLDYAATQASVSTDTLNQALEKFSTNLGKAQSGEGELAKILKANHITISGDLTRDFEKYADVIKNASNAEDRNAFVTAAFGKSAQEMGRLFNDGAAGIERAGNAAEAAGAVFGGDALTNAAALDQELKNTKISADALFRDLALETAPEWIGELRSLVNNLRDMRIGIDQLKHGDIGGAYNSLLDPTPSEGLFGTSFGRASDQQFMDYTLRHMRAGSANLTPGLTAETAADFYSGIIAAPTKISVHGANSVLPPSADAEKQANEIKKVTDALNLQIKALTETDRQKEIDNELAKAHVTLASAEGQKIADLAGKYYDEKKAIDDANQAANFLAQTTESAFESVLDGSSSVEDAFLSIAKAIAQAVLQAELLGSGPLAGILGTSPTTSGGAGGLLGTLFSFLMPHAKGGVYSSPDLSMYRNQVVDSPTFFRFAKGGVMGEAGPEAIMPLRRGPDGVLGVSAPANSNWSGGGIVIHNHIDARGGELGVETKIANAMHGLLRYQIPAAIEQHARNGGRRGYWPTPPMLTGNAA